MRVLAPLVVCMILLTACTTSGNTARVVENVAPVKTCSIPGVSCYVISRNSKDVGLELRNNGAVDLNGVTLTLEVTGCTLNKKTAAVDKLPSGATSPAHFTCDVAPTDLSGKVIMTYREGKSGEQKTAEGTIRIRR